MCRKAGFRCVVALMAGMRAALAEAYPVRVCSYVGQPAWSCVVAREYHDLKYCDLDDMPCVLATDENGVWHAWRHADGKWTEIEAADVSHKGYVIDKGHFGRSHPNIGLPEEVAHLN